MFDYNDNNELIIGIELADASATLQKNKAFIKGLNQEDQKKYKKAYNRKKTEVLRLASCYAYCKVSEYMFIDSQEQVECCNNLIKQHSEEISHFTLNGLLKELDALLEKLREEYIPLWYSCIQK